MHSLVILHANDIHGRVEGLARVATLVDRIRAENLDIPVLFFDLGDSEDTSSRLSNLTKGTAMHRLLSVAGCDAAAVGNAAWLRYGPQVLGEHAEAAAYPLLGLRGPRLGPESQVRCADDSARGARRLPGEPQSCPRGAGPAGG